ncbi:TetR/AcrR family transcriptional regulator [Nonomuraea cavernae]|uniref:Trancscriptional regulator,TetR n=1 Tax=Nonomuraea cavernae TaxID=2045107 RepID=A0A918DPT0_9ACTN|nr:TetR/AcrR family transcriptional regulator [Nonomuraea cavernae]MCA2189403.1 TetR/AcrR family transcriptional regulator [Nonomuraea cavernae]GGO76879.1 putative trancscriptional regulator,TetR [Nonomuraea cavernae]
MTTADDTRTRILAAAQELFAERGYSNTSLADIAAAVGLTKTAVAYHFHPKDRLAAELLAPAADDMLALLGTDFDGRAAFLDALVRFMVRHRAVIRLVMEDVNGADDAPPGSPGEAFRTFRDEIFTRLAGPEPGPESRLRGWAVLGALQWGVVQTVDLPAEQVEKVLTRAVQAI